MVEEQRHDVSGVGLERPTTVFLSYAREDVEAVKDLQLRLHVRGIRSWRDVVNLPVGSQTEDEIVHAIEHEVDALALYITPNSLKKRDFIWKIEVPAAWHRHELDPQFRIVPVLQGVTYTEVRQFCFNWHLPDLTQFNGISLIDGASGTTWEERNKQLNGAARSVLQAALALRLHRINADRSYEPWVCLKTFFFTPPVASLAYTCLYRASYRSPSRSVSHFAQVPESPCCLKGRKKPGALKYDLRRRSRCFMTLIITTREIHK